MDKYRCSVCKKHLTQEEVENYLRQHDKLELRWGTCEGENAYIEKINEGEENGS